MGDLIGPGKCRGLPSYGGKYESFCDGKTGTKRRPILEDLNQILLLLPLGRWPRGVLLSVLSAEEAGEGEVCSDLFT